MLSRAARAASPSNENGGNHAATHSSAEKALLAHHSRWISSLEIHGLTLTQESQTLTLIKACSDTCLGVINCCMRAGTYFSSKENVISHLYHSLKTRYDHAESKQPLIAYSSEQQEKTTRFWQQRKQFKNNCVAFSSLGLCALFKSLSKNIKYDQKSEGRLPLYTMLTIFIISFWIFSFLNRAILWMNGEASD